MGGNVGEEVWVGGTILSPGYPVNTAGPSEPRAEMLYPFRVLTQIYKRSILIPDNQLITSRSSRPEGLMLLSNIFNFARVFRVAWFFCRPLPAA